MCTFVRKRPGNRESNPSRRSGYQRNFISELQVHNILRMERQHAFDSPTASKGSSPARPVDPKMLNELPGVERSVMSSPQLLLDGQLPG
jgi:hypothetical protein